MKEKDYGLLTEPPFEDLSRDAQVFLAAWAVLVKSTPEVPPNQYEQSLIGWRFRRAAGAISSTIGLRARRYRPLARRKLNQPVRRTRKTERSVTA